MPGSSMRPRGWPGWSATVPPAERPHAPRTPDHSLEVRRILDGCRADRRHAGRDLPAIARAQDPGSPDLLFHPDLTDFERRRGWPGMVAIPARWRTASRRRHSPHLSARGWQRQGAARARRCWARRRGGGAALGRWRGRPSWRRRGHRDRAGRASALFGTPVWAALSADGLAPLPMARGCGTSPSTPMPAMPVVRPRRRCRTG
jgi:putative DNA primase/helicase